MDKFDLLKLILAEAITDPEMIAHFKQLGWKQDAQGNWSNPNAQPATTKGPVGTSWNPTPRPPLPTTFQSKAGVVPTGFSPEDSTKQDLGKTLPGGTTVGDKTAMARPISGTKTQANPPQIDNKSKQVMASMPSIGNIMLSLGNKKSGKIVLDFSNPDRITVSDQ